MSTASQIEANRRNSQLSTGPRTPEGKSASSRNSVRHGLSSASIDRFPAEIRDQYRAFHRQLFAELAPASALEDLSFEQYAFSQFMYLRAQIVEAHALEASFAKPSDAAARRDLDRASRYARGHANAAARALKQFQIFQANRLMAAEIQDTIGAPETSSIKVPISTPFHLILHPKEIRAGKADAALRIIAAAQQNEANPPAAAMAA